MKMTSHVTLCRFQGSNSISSDMYFNRETGAGGGMRQSQSYGSNFQVILHHQYLNLRYAMRTPTTQ